MSTFSRFLNRIRWLPLLLLGWGVLTGAARAAIPVEHWTHASGARVYLVASPSIPMLDVQLNFDGGSRRDPVSQAGLASATAGLLLAARQAPTGPTLPQFNPPL